MKLVIRFSLALLVSMLLFSSCGKENIEETGVIEGETPDPVEIVVNPLLSRSGGGVTGGLDFDCFEINFPFSFLKADESELEITSEADLEVAFSSAELEIVDFVYPLDVTLENGDVTQVENGEELAELFAACVPGGGWDEDDFPAYQISDENSCFALVYPLDLKDLDGDIITVEDEDAFNAALAAEPYLFVFPLSLIDEETNVFTVANVDGLFEVLLSCNEWEWEVSDSTNVWEWETGFEYIGCYMVEFPLAVIVDGETVTVDNHEELCDLMLQGNLEGYAYPMTLTDEEGSIVSVLDEEGLEELLAECWDFPIEIDDLILLYFGTQDISGGGSGCYEIEFPISTYENEFQEAGEFANQEELDQGISSGEYFCCLEYPVSVVLNSDSSTVVLENEADLFQLLSECD